MNKLVKSACVTAAAMLLLMAHGAGKHVLAQEGSAEQAPAEGASKKTTSETFGSWTVVCTSGEGKLCIVQQQLANAQNQQVLATAAVKLNPEGGAVFLVQTPSGVMIAPGMVLAVDNQEVAKAPFVACAPRACEAAFKIDQSLINSLAKGKALSATVQSIRGKGVNIVFQLDGFVKAYAAFKSGVSK